MKTTFSILFLLEAHEKDNLFSRSRPQTLRFDYSFVAHSRIISRKRPKQKLEIEPIIVGEILIHSDYPSWWEIK